MKLFALPYKFGEVFSNLRADQYAYRGDNQYIMWKVIPRRDVKHRLQLPVAAIVDLAGLRNPIVHLIHLMKNE